MHCIWVRKKLYVCMYYVNVDASPTMQQLQYLDGNGKTVRFIKAVEGEWTRLADLLGLGNAVESINQSAFGQNAMACRKVLSTWLQGAHRSPVTWKTLVDVVGEMELINLKKDLEIALGLCAEVEQDLKGKELTCILYVLQMYRYRCAKYCKYM